MTKELTIETLRTLAKPLVAFLAESKTGETKQYLSENELEEINGIREPLYMTRITGGIIVHYGTDGDWTKALLLPESHLDGENWGEQYSPTDEALEWFLSFN